MRRIHTAFAISLFIACFCGMAYSWGDTADQFSYTSDSSPAAPLPDDQG